MSRTPPLTTCLLESANLGQTVRMWTYRIAFPSIVSAIAIDTIRKFVSVSARSAS